MGVYCMASTMDLRKALIKPRLHWKAEKRVLECVSY